MNRYVPITFSAFFLLMAFLPSQVLAASITETKAAIGKDCVASGNYSTAMGYETTASGYASTAMGYETTASRYYSTAMGFYTTASGDDSTAMGYSTTASGYASTAMGYGTAAESPVSWAGGRSMQLTSSADHTFVWGYSDSAQSIPTANAFLIFPAGTIGRVGIGTPSPGAMLHIKGNGWPESFLFLDTHGVNQDSGIRFYENASVKGHLYYDAINDVLRFFHEGSNQLALHSNGNVGIGTINPSKKLYVNGSAGGTRAWNASDKREKTEIRPIKHALDNI